ncbi:uncharacterized protein LOC119160095 isoform X1 [Rhipicephalus microplus]|uniref:uncharacterized protein LOC119160095 isoform X1 n=1 Tax=Rhipicephalus microplus TaxID=6941 RepID=UPI003F6B70DF
MIRKSMGCADLLDYDSCILQKSRCSSPHSIPTPWFHERLHKYRRPHAPSFLFQSAVTCLTLVLRSSNHHRPRNDRLAAWFVAEKSTWTGVAANRRGDRWLFYASRTSFSLTLLAGHPAGDFYHIMSPLNPS